VEIEVNGGKGKLKESEEAKKICRTGIFLSYIFF
jgi:hypothetical protein